MKHSRLTLTCAAVFAAMPFSTAFAAAPGSSDPGSSGPANSAAANPPAETATAHKVSAAAKGVVDSGFLVPDDAAWGVVFDPNKVRDSELATQFFGHFDEEQRAEISEMIGGVSNMIGIDLRQDLGQVVAFGTGFAPEDVAVAFNVGDAQTNLEGLMLADENYESYEYGDLLMHSVKGDPGNPRVYCAVLPGAEGRDGVVLLSPSSDTAEGLVDAVRRGAVVAAAQGLGGDEFLRVWVDRIPVEMFSDTPRQSNIAGMIQSLQLVGSTGQDTTELRLSLTTNNPARARQIYQMAMGSKAFIQFAAGQDPEAEKIADVLSYVSVGDPAGGAVVSITASCDTESLAALLDMLDEAGAFDELGLD